MRILRATMNKLGLSLCSLSDSEKDHMLDEEKVKLFSRPNFTDSLFHQKRVKRKVQGSQDS